MEINKKTILYGVLIILTNLLLLTSFGVINFNFGKTSGTTGDITGGDYNNLPEKCRLPNGQDVNSWKDHLNHHADLQECLSYFN